jgi:hypothetical protein
MIYANHNFTANFLNAASFDDAMMIRNMIVDELARLIVENKKDVVNILRHENLNITVNDDNNTISQVLAKEIVNGNEKVIGALSKLISDNEFDSDEAKNFVNIFGIGKKNKSSGDRQKGVFKQKLATFLKKDATKEGLSDLIALGLKKSFDKSKAKQTQQSQAVLTERLKLNEMKASKEKKGGRKKKILIIGAISFSVAAIATAIILIRKSNRGGGGTIPATPPSV